MASVRAKPNIANRKSSFLIEGLRAVPTINEAKIKPIPIPAPQRPNVDNPAPIF